MKGHKGGVDTSADLRVFRSVSGEMQACCGCCDGAFVFGKYRLIVRRIAGNSGLGTFDIWRQGHDPIFLK